MASVVPDTTDMSVAALAIAWDIVSSAPKDVPEKRPTSLELAAEVRRAWLILMGSTPLKT